MVRSLTAKQIHKKYLRIAEIMVTDEYHDEIEKIGAIRAVCNIVFEGL